MNRNLTLSVIITVCLLAGNAFCADWKIYGEFTAVPDVHKFLFYDSNSIINTNNSIKLWVKIVLARDVEKISENKSVLERATKKLADGYIPPLTKIYPQIANAAYLEEAAYDQSVKSEAEILYQVECNENKIRKISGASADKKGVLNQPFGISNWERIAPESNADNLAKIVCGSK